MYSTASWRPVASKAIFVGSQDSRRDFEDNVMTTFCLRTVIHTERVRKGGPAQFKGILDISRIQVNPTHSAITLRGTPDQMLLA